MKTLWLVLQQMDYAVDFAEIRWSKRLSLDLKPKKALLSSIIEQSGANPRGLNPATPAP